ncbi:hypothetical protein ACEWY4_026186 [Coilia grayii]|uniref:protein-tyrosine-phosphatase n=1 Tax=Coilia grayii TaxID=363190 RepID=A0ABD1IX44_9TELE
MRATVWLLYLCTAQVWCQSTDHPDRSVAANAITTTTAEINTSQHPTDKSPFDLSTVTTVIPTTITTTVSTTPQPPPEVTEVNVTIRSDTQLQLEWAKVNSENKYNYTLRYWDGTEITITGSNEGTTVTHTVSSLSPGTKYSFTLFTVFEGVSSTGYHFSAVTVPADVTQVNVKTRSDTDLQLEWDKINNNDGYNQYNYTLRYSNGTETSITGSEGGATVTHTVSSLSPGTKYSFTLYTVFEGVISSGYNFSEVTVPADVTQVNVKNRSETHLQLEWDKINNNDGYNQYNYTLRYSNGTETSITGSEGGATVTHTVSSLSPGTKYSFTLYTVFEGVISSGYNFSEVTVPADVTQVNVKNRSETHLQLEWDKINNNDGYNQYTYTLRYSNGTETSITGSEGGTTVTHTVSSLSPGTKYSFTLFTVFEGVRSSGYNFSEVTVPSDVGEVNVTSRSENHLQLEWTKVSNSNGYNEYNYTLRYSNGAETSITGPDGGTTVTHTVPSLSPGTKYSFTLFTVFEGVSSRGHNFSEVTAINCAASHWKVTTSTIEAEVAGLFSMATAKNGSDGDNVNGKVEGNSVSFTDLYPGATYTVSLYYELQQEKLLQCTNGLTLVPEVVTSLSCDSGDFYVSLRWEEPLGVWTELEVNVGGNSYPVESGTELHVPGLQPAQTYSVSVTSLSGAMRSSPQPISCQTQSTVIWLPVLVIILLGLLAAVGVFVLRRKPKLLSKVHMPMYKRHTETDPSQNNFRAIPVKKFPDHFDHMSRDENREFSAEYMQFNTVGTEQTQREAILPENKSKNRFTDILPYDSSRVKLSTRGHVSDYINANYIPGYGGRNNDYIAAQGPLPSTVADFWRMIWEQKSTRIVMVTNCIENGKTKCEKYWPHDYNPCRYGDLVITMTSEHKEINWTLREFTVKNETKSEERVVKHFHFTAWPDHGVPNGTEPLIEFRGLIRRHIDSSPPSGPTVVHCSAGVGRTGTLIALDVLLQQLEREDAVNIGGFVHLMRCHRPRMVQTESQYIFLHQCISDTLTETPEEPLYVNTAAVIYENIAAI